jgi:3-phytase
MERTDRTASWLAIATLLTAAALASCTADSDSEAAVTLPEGVADVTAAVVTEQVAEDPDDPAIWIHPSAPEQSLILGTNKVEAPGGALLVFGLDGKIRQTIGGLDRPNNVDVEYGLRLEGDTVDIAVLTERIQQRLRVYRIERDGSGLTEISSENGLKVFEGATGDEAAPMGIALYRRPRDGAIFAIVGRKSGPATGYLWQYRLEDDGAGKVKATKVREFGGYSGKNEVESIAVDDALGYVYYSDEGYGIRKWTADPDDPNAERELAHFGAEGFEGDHEGIAIYARDDGTGYIICTDQLEDNSEYQFYAREGKQEDPHDHSELLRIIRGGADSTDGIEATSANLGPQFPHGLLVAMNSGGRNFLIFRWDDVVASQGLASEVR